VPLNALAALLGAFFSWLGAYPLFSYPMLLWLRRMPKAEGKLAAAPKEEWRAVRDEQL